MRLAALLMMVGCGGSDNSSPDASSSGVQVFEDTFDNYPAGWSGTSATPGKRSEGVGNPAPSMQFITSTLDTIETQIPVAYAGESFLATLELMQSFESDGDMQFRFIAGLQPNIGSIEYRVKRANGATTATINNIPVPSGDGFRTLRIRVDASGTSLEIDNTVAFNTPGTPGVTVPSVFVMIGGSSRSNAPPSRAGVQYVDNVRLYRGP